MKTVATTSIMRRPKDGESALYMTVTPEGDTFPAGADGAAEKETTHTVTARLYYGTEAQTDWMVEVSSADDSDWYTAETLNDMVGDIYINSIKKQGADCVVNYEVGESRWRDDNAFIVIRMKNGYGAVEKQVNCFALKRGETGDRGAVLRGPQAWEDCAVGYAFQAGGDGEEYKDVVVHKGNYYSCITSHQKTAGNYPLSTADTNGGLWRLADKMEIVATKILLSEYALVKNLGVETVEMKDKDGNVVFRAKDGAVTCRTGTFEDVEISGTLTEGTVQVRGTEWTEKPYVVTDMKSLTINDPCGNIVCLPTYYGFTDPVTEWDSEMAGKTVLSVPSYKKGGTHLTIQTGAVSGLEGWAALPEEAWAGLSDGFGSLLERCVVVAADPQTLVRSRNTAANAGMPAHTWNGMSPNTGATEQGYSGYGHGRFSYKGAMGRFVVMLPGQHLHLISSVEMVKNCHGVEEPCVVWHIENAADFATVAMRMLVNDSIGVHYEDFPSGTTNLDMVDGGVDYWQDMLFAPPILDVKRNGQGYGGGIVQLTLLLGGVDGKNALPQVVYE